jgi:hypothetical protein
LYFSIKEAMEKAASRMKGSLPGNKRRVYYLRKRIFLF